MEAEEREAAAAGRVGSVLGRGKLRLTRLLGVGGMAAVYEARHRNGSRFAIKLLHPSLGASERQRKRFLREAYIVNVIDHPGVVRVYDDGVHEDAAYLVMELLEGETVAAIQRRSRERLETRFVLRIADQLLEVLSAAHAHDVVHRDIKPENLFIEISGRLRVLDFGIARFEHVPGATVDTQAGTLLGTAAFMPQEQARGRWNEVDARSDLWAVGATLFSLFSGEFVHRCETANEQLGRAMTMPARSLASVRPDLPAGLIALIDRALRFAPDERWPDAVSMRAALRALGGANADIETRACEVVASGEARALPNVAITAAATMPALTRETTGSERSRVETMPSAARTRFALLTGLSIAFLFGLTVLLQSGASGARAAAAHEPRRAASPAPGDIGGRSLRALSPPVPRTEAQAPAESPQLRHEVSTPPHPQPVRSSGGRGHKPRADAHVDPFDLRF